MKHKLLGILSSFKTCNSFLKKAQNNFANNIQCLNVLGGLVIGRDQEETRQILHGDDPLCPTFRF